MVNERHRVNITVDGDKPANKSWNEMKAKDIQKNVKKIETKQPKCPVSAQKNTIEFGMVDDTATMKHINSS